MYTNKLLYRTGLKATHNNRCNCPFLNVSEHLNLMEESPLAAALDISDVNTTKS